MGIIYDLLLTLTFLAGGAGGWFMTTWHHEQVAAEHDQEEEEMVEFQELYAAWAMLHRIR